MDEFDMFLKPEKPFMLVSQVKATCDQQVAWFYTEYELLSYSNCNHAIIPMYAIEIGSSREIKLSNNYDKSEY